MKTRDITISALMAALLGISAYIYIPLAVSPVAVTMQTMVLNIIAIMLTPSAAFFAVLIYILTGAVGIPVFSGGVGGVSVLLSPTGGYILGFLLAAPAMSYAKGFFAKIFGKIIKSQKTSDITAYSVNAILVGMVIIYAMGMIYMRLLLGKAFGAAFVTMVMPFIPADLVKCVAAAMVSVPLLRTLNR